MLEKVFVAIDGDALHAKSKVYIGRALSRKADGDLDEYQLWASLAIELLGKSALAKRHPSLVVDPTHWQSMFVGRSQNYDRRQDYCGQDALSTLGLSRSKIRFGYAGLLRRIGGEAQR